MNNQTIFLLVVIIILLYWVYWQNSQSNLLTLEYKSQNKSLQQKAQNYQDLYQKRAEEKVLLDEKINDLETALFNSGKKNLAKKKETQELLENMESRWNFYKKQEKEWGEEKKDLKQEIKDLKWAVEYKKKELNEATEKRDGKKVIELKNELRELRVKFTKQSLGKTREEKSLVSETAKEDKETQTEDSRKQVFSYSSDSDNSYDNDVCKKMFEELEVQGKIKEEILSSEDEVDKSRERSLSTSDKGEKQRTEKSPVREIEKEEENSKDLEEEQFKRPKLGYSDTFGKKKEQEGKDFKRFVKLKTVTEFLDWNYDKDTCFIRLKLDFQQMFPYELELEGGKLNFKKYPSLEVLSLVSDLKLKTPITEIDVSCCPGLEVLDLSGNEWITSLNLKNNPKLKKLSLPKNLIGKLAQILTLEIRNNLEQEARNKAQLWLDRKGYSNFTDHNLRKGSLVKNIRDFVDISDLDEIVRNYDFSKVGDVEYHKRFGEQANYFCLGLGSIDNLSNKILVRCLIVQNRLVNGVNKDYENALYDYSEGQQLCAFMKAGNYTYEQAQEVVNKALNGDRELLSRLQDLPYLNPKYRLKE